MRALPWFCICVTAWGWGQQAQQLPAPAQPATPPPAQTTDAAAPPAGDRWVTGFIDLGYRWQTGPGGNENVYRSTVDLGAGPKLLEADFSILDPKHRWFDRVDVRAANWGDDPYTTLRVSARKGRVYDFTSQYRSIAYFNNLPSFANPLLERGVLTSERTFDIRNRMSSFDLALRPGTSIIPYFAYDRASGYGDGVSPFVSDQNEYPVPYRSDFSQNNIRAGLRIEMSKYHVTIEQGGTTFRDDQSMFQSAGANNPGNRGTPYFGNALYLSSLSQAARVDGHSVYTKALATAQPAVWLSLYGHYSYARPRNEANYGQAATGNFVLQSAGLPFTSQQSLLASAARVPHHGGQAGAEIRLHPRLRLVTNWITDRIHVSGNNAGQISFGGASSTEPVNLADSTTLRDERNQIEGDLLWDVKARLTVRGGYRYEWGAMSGITLPPAGLSNRDMAALRRSVGKLGFTYSHGSKLSITGDAEAAGTDSAYFRTSWSRYQRGRVQGSYQASSQLTFSGAFSAAGNRNPAPNIDFDSFGMQSSASVLWNPAAKKRFGFQGTYTRSTLRSNGIFLVPQTLQPERSRYKDNAHSIQSMLDLALPGVHSQAKLSAGGSVFISSGSRPTTYFQPTGRLVIPVGGGNSWISEWSYYGYGESFYVYEGFRSHLITTGIRIAR